MYNEEWYEIAEEQKYIKKIGGLNKGPVFDEHLINPFLVDFIKDDLIPEYSELFENNNIGNRDLYHIIKEKFIPKIATEKYNDRDLDIAGLQIKKIIDFDYFKNSFDVLINSYVQIENAFEKYKEL